MAHGIWHMAYGTWHMARRMGLANQLRLLRADDHEESDVEVA
jgi:hypothetical protein